MPFPFFNLPFEIRNIIYKNLFTPADENQRIAPDPKHFGHHMSLRPDRANELLHCQALALTRTCQQAHKEVTNVLYGDNTFEFDDFPYYEKDEYRHSDIYECGVYFPACDIIYLYAFLSRIGKANRQKIRHFQLYLSTDLYVTDPAEDYLLRSGLNGGASYISDALDFFSESHRLQTLVVWFHGSRSGLTAFSIWFSEGSRLMRRLKQFKAIERLACYTARHDSGFDQVIDVEEAAYKKAIEKYKELKLKLAAADPLESGQIDSSSTKYGFQSDPIAQIGA